MIDAIGGTYGAFCDDEPFDNARTINPEKEREEFFIKKLGKPLSQVFSYSNKMRLLYYVIYDIINFEQKS